MKLKKIKQRQRIDNLEIIEAAAEGNSLGKKDDMVVFVPFCVPGDIVNVEVERQKKNYCQASLIEVLHYSDKREKEKCPHFGICGGCKWQIMQYSWQLFYKNKQVLDNLQRIGRIDTSNASYIIGADREYFYRNKLEYTFSTKSYLTKQEIQSKENNLQKPALGFHVPKFFDKVIDIEYCALQEEPSNEIRNFIRDYTLKNNLTYYDIKGHFGLMRNIIIRLTTTKEIMLIVCFAQKSKEILPLLNAIKDKFPQITSLMYCINEKLNDTIFDQKIICFSGKDHIVEKMPYYNDSKKSLKFKIGAKSFYQTNSLQAYKLYSKAVEFAQLKREYLVYDLYCGIGTITNFIAPYVREVIGIEQVEDAILDARNNSEFNGIRNTKFFAGDTEKILDEDFIKENGKPDIVITDPPRAGMHQKVIETLLEIEAKKIIYISCNPASQARDSLLLMEKYSVGRIQSVDMFPQTQHVENIIEFILK
ncbi:MAG: 23S rRNA (uracil(1939)-C(5))-methyltransferase RlmD [Bacteroidales bacterium]|jgi:23S rRNA (uracil1939-C5)-methyltransferase|nr:23S rRNA (uracil(1939)-C(5))-methyltransferase RlmD [Bacteroidales bacterium]